MVVVFPDPDGPRKPKISPSWMEKSIPAKASYNGLTDQEALEILNRYFRDNARIPLRWNKHKWGGFTTGQPWLQGAVKGNLTDVEIGRAHV